MKTRMMRKIAVLVTGSALALSFPVASSVADPGQPNDGNGHSKACENVGKSKGHGPKKSLTDLPSQAQGKGWKCGFQKGQNGTNGNGTNGNGTNGNGTNGKACPGKGNPEHPSKDAPNDNGKKCGFEKGQNGNNLD